jgi:hypothetical protein
MIGLRTCIKILKRTYLTAKTPRRKENMFNFFGFFSLILTFAPLRLRGKEVLLQTLRKWRDKPSGQVLVATLFFCFIFFTLFIGLYKSGMIYSAKERATRATDLTALSIGAVYANGLQLVRLTNAILLAFAAIDLVVIAAAVAITEGAASAAIEKADPHFRKAVQIVQNLLFGVTLPTGAYPLLMLAEGLSSATDNRLKNNWPSPTHLSLQVPIPPSPLFLFNIEGSDPLRAAIPNMALKFRKGNFFLDALNKPPKEQLRYHLTSRKTGQIHYFTPNEVDIAPNSKNPGQMWVKEGDFKSRYVVLEKDVEQEAEKDAEQRLKKTSLAKLKSAMGLSNLMSGIDMDVTDRDTPPDHTVIVYSDFPTSVKNPGGSASEIQTFSETDVEGDGLAAWNLNDPPYTVQLAPLDPTRATQLLDIQSRVTNMANSGQFPSISNVFDMANNGQSQNP